MSSASSKTQTRRLRLLELLSDGSFHSGEHLAKKLRISRAGIWKSMEILRAMGIEIQSVPRQGYRLPRPVDLLKKELLLDAVPTRTRALIERTDVLLTIDSTNQFVAETSPGTPGRAHLCVTELQTAGRGRRGRHWIAPFGSGICLSLGWRFSEAPPTFSALSLAVGVATINALRRFGANELGLKWPNDLVWQQRKLGGILTEMRGESAGPSQVIIGVGINMLMPAAVRVALAEQQAALIADVHEVLRDKTPTRNAVIAALAEELIAMLQVFTQDGFAPFADEWRRLDALADAPVKVITAEETTFGIARSVENDGTLLVEVNGVMRRFVSGDVSLRQARSG